MTIFSRGPRREYDPNKESAREINICFCGVLINRCAVDTADVEEEQRQFRTMYYLNLFHVLSLAYFADVNYGIIY